MQDDDLLLYRGDAARDAALRRMKALGADTVRATVLWTNVAQGARRRGFVAADHTTYPQHRWDPYDNLSKVATALGLTVLFNVTGPGPAWAHERAPVARLQRSWKPSPAGFEAFVTAVGRRFAGGVVDPTDGVAIPRVSSWSVWNEPNQAGWLSPQWERGRPASPALYRALFAAGRRGLDASGHEHDFVLVGETAPLGRSRGTPKGPADPVRPKLFLRELLCERRRSPGCATTAGRTPLRASGWAHHPYTRARPIRP